MGWWSAAGMGATSGLAQPCTSTTPLFCRACLAASSFPKSPAVQWGAPSHSRSACLSIYGPSLSRSVRCVYVCVCVFLGGVEGVLAVLALLTSRRSMLPAPSMSAHTPLPCRLDLTVGGDDGENLGSWRGVVDPKESERQRKTDRSPEAYLHPTGRSSDSPTLNGSLNLSLLGFFAREQKGCEMTADLLGSVWSLSRISVLLSLQASFLAQKL